MSYRPSDEGGCLAASWGDSDLGCVPGPVEVVAALGSIVALSRCERCGSVEVEDVEQSRGWLSVEDIELPWM